MFFILLADLGLITTTRNSPNFLAFFPCPASYPSLLGELYSSAFTSAAFNWICSPAVTELETIVMDWLAQMLALPQTYLSTGPTQGGGVILGGASEAVLTTMVTARDKYLAETLPAADTVSEEELDELTMRKRSRLVALGSSACHSSTKKAAKILGVRYLAVPVSSKTNYAMTGPALWDTLAMCRAKGWEPFFLTAALGTTDTCAVDDMGAVGEVLAEWSKDFPISTPPTSTPTTPPTTANGTTNGTTTTTNGITTTNGASLNGSVTHHEQSDPTTAAPISRKGEIWVHVDAAYAGSALVTPEAQQAVGVHHLQHFHSFNVNMHKWLLTNFDASCLFVTGRRWLEAAMSSELHVYRNAYSDVGAVTDYRNWQIPLGRRFRSLKVWFVLRSYGATGLQAYIRRGVALGETFAGWVRARSDLFEVLTGPVFALTVIRVCAGPETSEAQRNVFTQRVYEEVNRSGRVWLTSTLLEGKFAIRVMTANESTQEKHVREAWELIEATAERVVKEG